MTYALAAQAQRITRLSMAQRLVLMHLCQVANEEMDWRVWHSQAQIAIWNGMGERTVRDALERLEEERLIRTGKFAGEMLGRNVYTVDVRRVELMAQADRYEADEKVKAWRIRGREKKAQQRIRQAIVRDLRAVPDPVDNPETGT